MFSHRYILRMELNGEGLYAGTYSAWHRITKNKRPNPTHTNIHVLPHHDRKIVKHFPKPSDIAPYRFGFANLKQYFAWFYEYEWRVEASRIGVQLQLYKVRTNNCVCSNTQAVFLKSAAELIAVYDPTHFDDISFIGKLKNWKVWL